MFDLNVRYPAYAYGRAPTPPPTATAKGGYPARAPPLDCEPARRPVLEVVVVEVVVEPVAAEAVEILFSLEILVEVGGNLLPERETLGRQG